MIRRAILFLCVCSTLLSIQALCQAAPRRVTVCDLNNNWQALNGKQVVLVATVKVSHEASWLESGGCSVAFTYPDSPNVKVDFVLRKDENWSKFEKFVQARSEMVKGCADCMRYIVRATFIGQAQGSKEGFGHLGMAHARLVIQSVSNVEATEKKIDAQASSSGEAASGKPGTGNRGETGDRRDVFC